MWLGAEGCHPSWLWQSEWTLPPTAFGHEMLTQSPRYTGLLSNSLDTQMTSGQVTRQTYSRKLGIQGEKCLPHLEGVLGGSDSQNDVYLSAGQQSANVSERLNPLSLATSSWHSVRVHSLFEKAQQEFPGQCSWASQVAPAKPRTHECGLKRWKPRHVTCETLHCEEWSGAGLAGHLRLWVRHRVQGL